MTEELIRKFVKMVFIVDVGFDPKFTDEIWEALEKDASGGHSCSSGNHGDGCSKCFVEEVEKVTNEILKWARKENILTED